MADLLGGDIFSDPVAKTVEDSSGDIFGSAVSTQPVMKSVSLDSPVDPEPGNLVFK